MSRWPKLIWGIAACLGLGALGTCVAVMRNQSISNAAQYTRSISARLSVVWCKHFLDGAARDLAVPGRGVAIVQFQITEAAAFAKGAKRLLLPPGAAGSQSGPWLGLAAVERGGGGKMSLLLYWLDDASNDLRGFYVKGPDNRERFFQSDQLGKHSQYPRFANIVHLATVPFADATIGDVPVSEQGSFRHPARALTLSKKALHSRLVVGLLLSDGGESNPVVMATSDTAGRNFAK